MPAARSQCLSALRARLAPFAPQPAETRVLVFGDARVDGCFPQGGLPLGRLHEIGADGRDVETGAVGAAFAAGCLARLSAEGAVVWSVLRDDLYAPGLACLGMSPDRLIFVRARDDAESLGVMEDALRAEGVAAVLGEVGRLDLTAGRRLQLACETSGATAFALRRWPFGRPRRARAVREPSAATTRWRVLPAPSEPEEPGLGAARWRVELEHCRGGRGGAWIMEACDATGDVRVVAELADRAAEAVPLPARRAG